jgi:hypothetical protein
MTTRRYKGYELRNVGISWYVYGILGDFSGRWIAKSFAEAKRWVDANLAGARR